MTSGRRRKGRPTIIRDEEPHGSINRTTAHPRVPAEGCSWLRRALICDHHHPRGTAGPSPNDMRLTGRTRDLLDEIEVRLLNPIVVSPTATVSMAARGLI